MTPDERLELDARQLVSLWARVLTLLKQQCSGITDEELLNVATALATAEIQRNGAHSK